MLMELSSSVRSARDAQSNDINYSNFIDNAAIPLNSLILYEYWPENFINSEMFIFHKHHMTIVQITQANDTN